MQNQKGNIGVIVSFIIVIGLVGLIVYSLMHKPITENPLEGINSGSISDTTPTDQATPASDSNNPNGSTTNGNQLSTPQEKNMNTNTRILSSFTPVAKVSSLEKIDLIKGTGAEAKASDTVSVQYTGAVAATGVIFQSSKDFGTDPVTFALSTVIKGWTDGIPGMKIGGTRRLVIPADQAYGANPPAGSGIPANADLVFDVELVAIK